MNTTAEGKVSAGRSAAEGLEPSQELSRDAGNDLISAKTTVPVEPSRRRLRRRRRLLQQMLAPAGITINGNRPFDVRVLDDAFYEKAVPRGLLGMLDAYVAGWWDADRLDELAARVLAAGADLPGAGRLWMFWNELKARVLNFQSRRRALEVNAHYALGNDLFQAMLDRHMQYTCGYWKDAEDLEEAQLAKLDLIARKLRLAPGKRVLDIGCGWGGFARYAAENYGVEVVGITISREQYEFARESCAGLPVEVRLQDYRDLGDDDFDAVLVCGMIEHVGYKNYRTLMSAVRRSLKREGLFLLHTIGGNESKVTSNPWTQRHIFPNGMIPSLRQLADATGGLLVLEDWHNFGPDYDKTLLAWFRKFDASWHELRPKYGPKFYRMWKCYLLTSAGSFRARDSQLWQLVFSPHGLAGGYSSIR